MIIVSQVLLNILTLNNRRVVAMALWPIIILKNKDMKINLEIINHERIHHRQQLELLILPYYFWYFLEYWYYMFSSKMNHQTAYMKISFEKEAYSNQDNLNYLKERKFLSNLPYFNK